MLLESVPKMTFHIPKEKVFYRFSPQVLNDKSND